MDLVAYDSGAQQCCERPFIRHVPALDHVDRPAMKQRLSGGDVQQVVVIEPGLPVDMERPGRRIEDPALLLVGLEEQALNAPIIGCRTISLTVWEALPVMAYSL